MLGVRFVLSLTVVLSLATIACRPPDNARSGDATDVSMSIALPDDPVVGPAPVTVHLERGGEVVRAAQVEVTGDMTHAGMTPVVATATEQDDGSYRADAFAFSMAGDWVVSVEADLPSGSQLRGEVETTVGRP